MVVLLLTWTAADLTNTALCALDGSALPISAGTADFAQNPGSDSTQKVPPHIDDCFCCSHCVEVWALFPVFDVPGRPPSASYALSPPPHVPAAPPYHPPKA